MSSAFSAAQQALQELQALLGNDCQQTSDARYCQDWRETFQQTPLCVVFPPDVASVQNIVHICLKHKIAMVPQGGNTSLCGGAVARHVGQIILSLDKMCAIRALYPHSGVLIAEAGCTLAQLQKHVYAHGFDYPLSLPSQNRCTLGGNISTNAGGVHVVRYGNTRQLCLGLEAVLPDGTLYQGLSPLVKNNMGYDFKHLLIGAEGTLGIITAASMQLVPQASKHSLFLLGVHTPQDLLTLYGVCRRQWAGLLTAFECMNANSLQTVHSYDATLCHGIIPQHAYTYPWLVLLEVAHFAHMDMNMPALVHTMTQCHATLLRQEEKDNTPQSADAGREELAKLWQIRHSIPYAQKALGGNIKHDISFAVENLPDAMQDLSAAVYQQDAHAQLIVFGHVGDGNLHFNVVSHKPPETIHQAVYTVVATYGGSMAAEHGIGQIKTQILQAHTSPSVYGYLHNIKKIMDPYQLFNPGVMWRD